MGINQLGSALYGYLLGIKIVILGVYP